MSIFTMNEEQKKIYEEIKYERDYSTPAFAYLSKLSEEIVSRVAEDYGIDFEEAIETLILIGSNAFYNLK